MQLRGKLFFVLLLVLQSIFIQAQVVDIVQTAINQNFTTLTTAVTAANLVSTLKGPGPFTVFAPTDAAFNALPSGVVADLVKPENNQTLNKILLYHVITGNVTSSVITAMALPANVATVQGGNVLVNKNATAVRVNTANVIVPDLFATNGVIHAIDQVLLPPLNLVETAVTNGMFKTLVTALRAADLVSALQGVGPFTVFAPNDAAFSKLSSGVLTNLLKPENKNKLSDILKYHVITRRITAADILAMTSPSSVTTLGGANLTITKEGSTVKVNGASVLRTDVSTSNGLIHIIDTVLVPPGVSLPSASTSLNQGLLTILILTILARIV